MNAARLVKDLLKTLPDMKISALGGDELRSAGAINFPGSLCSGWIDRGDQELWDFSKNI